MAKVIFQSIDTNARTATFIVEGFAEPVTRRIPKQFDGNVDDYMVALADGLAIEGDEALARATMVAIAPTIAPGTDLSAQIDALRAAREAAAGGT